MRKKEKPEEKIMTALELARRQMSKHVGGTCACEIDRMTRQCSVALGYLSRVTEEKYIFGPLVEALKFRQMAYENSPPGAMCKGEYLTIKQTLETFYKENPSWKK